MDIKKLEKFSVENYREGTTPLLFKLLGGEWTKVDVGVKGDWKLVFSKNDKLFIYEDGNKLLIDFRYPSKLGVKQALYCNYKDVEYEPALFGEGFKWTPGNTVKGIKLGEVKKGIGEKVDWTKEEREQRRLERKRLEEEKRRRFEEAEKELEEKFRREEEERKKREEEEKKREEERRAWEKIMMERELMLEKRYEESGIPMKYLVSMTDEEYYKANPKNRKYVGGIYNHWEKGYKIGNTVGDLRPTINREENKPWNKDEAIYYKVNIIEANHIKSKNGRGKGYYEIQIDLKDEVGQLYPLIAMPSLKQILSCIRVDGKKLKGLDRKNKKELLRIVRSFPVRISLDKNDNYCRWWPVDDKGAYKINRRNITCWVYDYRELFKEEPNNE